MKRMINVAAELLKGEQSIPANGAGVVMFKLTEEIGIAAFAPSYGNPHGSAHIIINDGRAWWQAGDRREFLNEKLPALAEFPSFTYEPDELASFIDTVKRAVLQAAVCKTPNISAA